MAGHEIDDGSGARAESPCFLVATAAASSRTHEWRVDHVVESCRIWLARHVVVMHWLERVKIGQLALQVALPGEICVERGGPCSNRIAEMGLNHRAPWFKK